MLLAFLFRHAHLLDSLGVMLKSIDEAEMVTMMDLEKPLWLDRRTSYLPKSPLGDGCNPHIFPDRTFLDNMLTTMNSASNLSTFLDAFESWTFRPFHSRLHVFISQHDKCLTRYSNIVHKVYEKYLGLGLNLKVNFGAGMSHIYTFQSEQKLSMHCQVVTL